MNRYMTSGAGLRLRHARTSRSGELLVRACPSVRAGEALQLSPTSPLAAPSIGATSCELRLAPGESLSRDAASAPSDLLNGV